MNRIIIPYNPNLKELARQLRNGSTKAEIILWQKLKRKQMYGYDFDRQKPVDNYILDFFCYELMLGIEVDGYSHELIEIQNKDAFKEAKMNEFGITVLRFSDHQVFKNMENVLWAIVGYILEFEKNAGEEHTPSPSRERRSFTHAGAEVDTAFERHTPDPSREGKSFTHAGSCVEFVEHTPNSQEGRNYTHAGNTEVDIAFEKHSPNPSQEGKSYTHAGSSEPDNFKLEEHTPSPSQEGKSFTHTLEAPPQLSSGDKVGIVSTAKRTEPHETEQGIATLKSWGLEPVVGAHTFSEYGFLAGTDAERLSDLQQMLDDENIKAIFFTKGGYGTLRIIDDIDWTKFRQHPKWLVGYSDITLLHCHVHNFGIQSLHAVMLQAYTKSSPESTQTIRRALFGESLDYEIPAHPLNRWNGQVIEGILVGGNLSMLYSITGSESDIDMQGKILFIEDIDEYLYHYDRMLVSLKRAGKLKGLKAVIVGQMVDIKESTLPWGKNDMEITLEHFDCPVIFDFPAGHVADNRALVMGREVRISDSGTIKIEFL